MYQNLATFTYHVKKHNHLWVSTRRLQSFHVDHEFRMGEAWLVRNPGDRVSLWTWFKYDLKSEEHVRNGRMRCFVGNKKLTQKGSIAREIFFEVGKDGKVLPLPCQNDTDPDGIRALGEDSFLLRMKFVKGTDIKFDGRAFQKGPVYGRKWIKGCP